MVVTILVSIAVTNLVSIVVTALVSIAVTVSASIAVITQVVKVTVVGGNLGAVGTVLETLEAIH